MKIAAVVAEYNPFHCGHKYQLEKTREAGATHIVAVMSGNFVQRGEAAIFDKFTRARAALSCGADLVVEIPVPWAMSTAQNFARGAVSIAGAFGCVDMLSFGSECDDISLLEHVAQVVYSADFESTLAELLPSCVSYAAAREQAVANLAGEKAANLLSNPNSILAVEYIAAVKKFGLGFQLNAVRRYGDGYNSTVASGCGFASASAIRRLVASDEDFSSFVPVTYPSDFADAARLDTTVLYALRKLTAKDIALAPDISEGLENRIYEASRVSGSVAELIDNIKTKRYPTARIRRIIMSLLLGLKSEHSQGLPPYIRVLACNEKGRQILSAAEPSLPVVARASQFKQLDAAAGEIFSLECMADDIYALCFSPARECGADYKAKVF